MRTNDASLLKRMSLCIVALGCVGAVLWTATRSDAVDTESLRRKQQIQVRARAMARELVSGILDLQLQQLEENGLTERRIYREVLSMRKNIDGLVEVEMREVVALLVQGQAQRGQERNATFVAARQASCLKY